MTTFVQPLLRRAAACLNGPLSAPSTRFAIVVAIVAAIASSH